MSSLGVPYGGGLLEPETPIFAGDGGSPDFSIGLTYSSEQEYLGDHHDSNGYQGYNWHQAAQPELIYDFEDPEPLPEGVEGSFASGTMAIGDKIYVAYSASGYLEFQRVAEFSSTFRGVNGTVGVLEHIIVADGIDYDVVHDRLGNKFTFFGADAGGAAKQFWKRENPEEVVLFTGHETDISLAASLGYGSDLAVDVQYDADGRRASFTYSTVVGLNRLESISIEVPVSGSGWSEISRVDYDYYGSGNSNGLPGDLQSATVSSELSDTGVRVEETTYYRYYTNSAGAGHPHFLRMVVEPEGVRRFGIDNPSTSIDSVSHATLAPYSFVEYEYYPETITSGGGTFVDPQNSMRVKKMKTASGCSCGSDGVHEFRYEKNPAYTDTSAYDTEWVYRTIISTPSGLWHTIYLDETKAPLSQVSSVGDPASATDVWATLVERDADGYVSAIHSPENITSYTHGSTDPSATVAVSFTCSPTSGLVTTYDRFGTGETAYADAVLHYIKAVRHQEGWGSGVTSYIDVAYDMAAQVEYVGGAELTRVYITSIRPFEDEVVSPSGSASDLTTTYYHSFEPSGSVVLDYSVVVSPVPATSKNGSNTSSVSRFYFRQDGSPSFIGHPDGTYDYYKYDRGDLVLQIEDAYDSSVEITDALPTGVTFGTTDSLQRTTRWAYDELGRAIYEQSWDGRLSYDYFTKLADERVVAVSFPLVEATLSGGAPDPTQVPTDFYGPASFTVVNLAGQPEEMGTVTIPSGVTVISQADLVDETESSAFDAFALGTSTGMGDLGSLQRILYNKGGWMAEEVQAYFDIPSPGTGVGTEGVNFDSTYFEYDASGNLARVQDPTGTIRTYEYDEWSQPIAEWMGTDDSGSGNMVLLKEYEYDNGNDGGNFNLTKVTLQEDGSTTHVTTIEHDYRGRALLVEGPEAPHLFAKLDNLGRTVAIGEYSDVSSISITSNDPTTTITNRVGLREASYDELGRVWRTKLHDIEQPSSGVSGGTSLSSLESLYWYDSMSRLRKTTGQSYAKYSYDSLGRMTRSYLLGGDNDSTYADALDASGDVVAEERQSSFGEDSDYLAFSLNIDRFHDSGSTSPLGPLDTDSGTTPTPNLVEFSHLVGRATATGYTYDALGRLKTRTFVGVPDSSDFSSGFEWDHDDATASNPSVGLETTVGYAARGHQETVTDPKGRVSKREVDALGRTVATYANYKDGVLDAIDLTNDPGSAGGTDHWDDDQKVSYTYIDGLLATIRAHDPSNEVDDPDQVTTYTYGTAVSGAGPLSDVATGHLISEVEYPDSTSSSDVVSMAYNRFGQVIWNKDQAGNVLERDIDGLGRTTALRATTIATGFDDRVKRIERGYDERGGLSLITQYSAATGGSVLDQVAIDRFGHGGIRTMEQDVDSAISGGSGIVPKTLTYRYELSTGGRSSFRRTKQFLPSDREFSFSYSSGIDDELSRVSIVMDDRRRVTSYKYLGADRVVGTNYGVPDVNSNLFGSTSGAYPGLDEYNRVVHFKWTKEHSTGSVDFYDVSLTLDDNSNPELILDNVIDTWDVEAKHDELNRIISFEEGDWNGSGFSATRSNELWDYDQIGNWVNFDSDWGGLSPAITESRESGDANEIETRDTDDDGTTDETLVYDAVGNLTSTGTHSFLYDVWGRQVEVSIGGTSSGIQTLIAEYEYNGLGYRVREHTDIDESGTLDSSDEWLSHVYDEDWRIIATYRGGDLADSAKAEYLFHSAGFDGRGGSSFINSAIARWRDAGPGGWDSSSDGVLEEEHYYCANHCGDTVAILDDSGRTVEWVRYSAYGVPFGIPVADITLNGLLGQADLNAMNAIISGSGYSVVADANLDGVVDAADVNYATDMFNSGSTGGYSVLSSFGHRIGYAGMLYEGSTRYLVRNREYIAKFGVWMQSDPLHYSDGLNVFAYVGASPIAYFDPMGLQAIGPFAASDESLKNNPDWPGNWKSCQGGGGGQYYGGAYPHPPLEAQSRWSTPQLNPLELPEHVLFQQGFYDIPIMPTGKGTNDPFVNWLADHVDEGVMLASMALPTGWLFRGVGLGAKGVWWGVGKCFGKSKVWRAAPRPSGVPLNWVPKPSRTGGGTRFVDPSNPHNSVRVMPGSPSSPFPNSRQPYVRVQSHGNALDGAGNVVPKNSPEAHIPLDGFKFLGVD